MKRKVPNPNICSADDCDSFSDNLLIQWSVNKLIIKKIIFSSNFTIISTELRDELPLKITICIFKWLLCFFIMDLIESQKDRINICVSVYG